MSGLFSVCLLLFCLASLASASAVVFNTIENPLPGNSPSIGFQATQTSKVGSRVDIAVIPGLDNKLASATVQLSVWACSEVSITYSACETLPGSTFSHLITLEIWTTSNVLLLSRTKAFDIPYRPSATPDLCPNDNTKFRWYSVADGICYNGYNTLITFDLSSSGVVLPAEFIYAVGFSTQTYGSPPMGVPGPYDSLNVGFTNVTVSDDLVGSTPDPYTMYELW
jgi:hypothetical protein